MKVALVHDYLREYGGAERVVETLHELFPEAPLYVAYLNLKTLGPNAERFKGWDIKTSWIQRIPNAGKLLSPLRLFAPMVFEGFDLKSYDVVISSTGVYFSDAVITKPETLHLAYIHTPPKYLYGYATSFNYKKHWWTRVGAEVANHLLRIYDFNIAQRPNILVANSKNVAARIKKFYRREAEVIYPPVDVEEFDIKDKKVGDYYLSLARLWKGKGVDLVVKTCREAGVKLKVAGGGPELEALKKMADQNIEFLGHVTDRERVELLSEARALIVATEDEDFGITSVEAQAAGTPVIALKVGGYLETVIPGKTGEFFDEPTAQSLLRVLEKFDPENYKAEDCRKNAEKFSKERFKEGILKLIKDNFPVNS